MVQEESDTFRQLIHSLALPTSLQREDWRSFVGERSKGICVICRSVLNSFMQWRRQGTSAEKMRHTAIKVCTLLNLQTYPVCDGIITINLVSKSNFVCVCVCVCVCYTNKTLKIKNFYFIIFILLYYYISYFFFFFYMYPINTNSNITLII